MLASDLNNPNFSGATDPDRLLHVVFYMRSEIDNFKSEQEGRKIFYEVPYVRILTPGNQLSEIDTPAREDHKQRFPLHWAAFTNSQSQETIVGTPVEEWPALSRAEAEGLKAIKFFTVEQIAGASDLQSQRLGMNASALRQKAQAFLAAAKDSALPQKQAMELAEKDKQIQDLNNRLAVLTEQVSKILDNSGQKPKRKYTKKEKTDAEDIHRV